MSKSGPIIIGLLCITIVGAYYFVPNKRVKPVRYTINTDKLEKIQQAHAAEMNPPPPPAGQNPAATASQQQLIDIRVQKLGKLFDSESMEQFTNNELEQIARNSGVTMTSDPARHPTSTVPVVFITENNQSIHALRTSFHFAISCDYSQLNVFVDNLQKSDFQLDLNKMNVFFKHNSENVDAGITLYLYYEEGS